MVKTNEWFGSGGRAFRRILVTQRFRQVIVVNCLRGLRFEPIEIEPAE